MATRSRSERLEGSSCFFLESLAESEDGREETYLEGVAVQGGMAPVVVHIEAYKAEDGEVEEDFPPRNKAAEIVERVSKVCAWLLFLRRSR